VEWLKQIWWQNKPVTKPPIPSPTKPPVPSPPIPSLPVLAFEAKLLSLHNQAREARNLRSLTLEDRLSKAAQKHAEWMAAHQKMSHTGAGGSNHLDRIKDEGYVTRGSGENIAMGYPNEETVMKGWLNSAGHRANILNTSWRHVGFGLKVDSRGRSWWAAVFAIPYYSGDRILREVVILNTGGLVSPDIELEDVTFEDDLSIHSFGTLVQRTGDSLDLSSQNSPNRTS
jgi:uncharacterized protein YkwD